MLPALVPWTNCSPPSADKDKAVAIIRVALAVNQVAPLRRRPERDGEITTRTLAALHQPAYDTVSPTWQNRCARQGAPAEPPATEIPFVFDTVAARYGKDTTDADRAVAQSMNAYWANFAKTGNPNGPGLPEWPAYSPKTDILMDFTATGPVATPDPWKDRLNLVERLAKPKN